MEGLARAAGAGVYIKIPKGWPGPLTGGFDEYHHPSFRVEEYAVVEQHLLKNRVSPIEAIVPELNKLKQLDDQRVARKLAKQLTDRAYEDLRKSKEQNRMSVEDVERYLQTPEGALFAMRLCIGRAHPGISDAEIRRIYDWLGEEETRVMREKVAGVDLLGNSTGPTENEPALKPEPVGLLTGESSIGTSPKSTVGTTEPSAT